VKLIYCLLFIISLTGCSPEHDISPQDVGEITVLFDQKMHSYKPGSHVHTKLTSWLSQNRDGWEKYYATPAIGKYVIKSDSFTLYVNRNSAVLNYKNSSGEYSQISRVANIKDFDFIDK
jgi:hypothetical protein